MEVSVSQSPKKAPITNLLKHGPDCDFKCAAKEKKMSTIQYWYSIRCKSKKLPDHKSIYK